MGMTGEALTEDEKKTYLTNLSISQLVDVIFYCEKQNPELAIYSPKTKEILEEMKNVAKAGHKDMFSGRFGSQNNTSSYPVPGKGFPIKFEDRDRVRLIDDNPDNAFSVKVY